MGRAGSTGGWYVMRIYTSTHTGFFALRAIYTYGLTQYVGVNYNVITIKVY